MRPTPTLWTADSTEGWTHPEALAYNGCLVPRAFCGKWNAFQREIDEAMARVGIGLEVTIQNGNPTDLEMGILKLLYEVDLPPSLTEQLYKDAHSMASAMSGKPH